VPLTRLTLTDFRSYADMTIEPGPGFVVLTGDNGAGKTNILEAVSLLAPGRGLRGAALGEMARKDGAAGFSVSARMGDVDLGTGTLATAPERRVVRINGATASATALSEWLSIVWLTPAQDRLFSDTPGARRRFFDRLVMALDPGHARHSARYEAAVRQRNRLLADDRPDHEWLAALENAMEEHGIEIERARMQTAIAITTAQASTRTDFPQFSLMIQSSGPISAKRLAANRGVHAARTAHRRFAGQISRQVAAGRQQLDRRTKGASPRHRAGPCRSGRGCAPGKADPVAR
jgi:DNA replication and repair protein RecF